MACCFLARDSMLPKSIKTRAHSRTCGQRSCNPYSRAPEKSSQGEYSLITLSSDDS